MTVTYLLLIRLLRVDFSSKQSPPHQLMEAKSENHFWHWLVASGHALLSLTYDSLLSLYLRYLTTLYFTLCRLTVLNLAFTVLHLVSVCLPYAPSLTFPFFTEPYFNFFNFVFHSVFLHFSVITWPSLSWSTGATSVDDKGFYLSRVFRKPAQMTRFIYSKILG